MKCLLFLFVVLNSLSASAQKKKVPPVPELPDVNKLMKMSPAELEAYKQKMIKQTSQQAADYADASGLAVNKTLIPGFEPKPPKMDVQRLNLLPSQPPTRTQIVSALQQSSQQIQKGMPAPKVEEIKKFTATQPVEVVNQKAVLEFYSDDPKGAILTLMEMAAKQPDSLFVLNNLGAMMNQHGIEHIAVGLFQYCLQKEPRSAILLNNIGQSFYGLGDLMKAGAYLNQCLAIDSLNPEANHTMGMLHYFKKEYDAALKCFERELSVAYRRSTLAMAYKMGKKFNLRELAARRRKHNGRPQKDYFEEINLGKFSLPDFPKTAKEIYENRKKYEEIAAIYGAESLTWMNRSQEVNQNSIKQKGDRYAGPYWNLVEAMLEELHEEFTPEYRSNLRPKDFKTWQEIYKANMDVFMAIKCPPVTPGMSISAQEAQEIKCCRERMAPVIDKLVSELSGLMEPKFKVGQGRWKAYINQLVEIVQLEPSPANQMMVYGAVSNYFSYLSQGMMHFSNEINNFLPKCYEPLTDEEANQLIESDKKWKLECPPWLNAEVDFGGMVVKVDCNKYAIEVGQTIKGAFEHEFKSGQSTLLIGPGMDGSFAGIKAGMKTQAFITFDANKQFSDFGIKRTLEVEVSGTPIPYGPKIKLGGNLAGIEISDKVMIMSGKTEGEVELKGLPAAIWGKNPFGN